MTSHRDTFFFSFLASTLHRARSPLYPSLSSIIDIGVAFTSPTTHIFGVLKRPEDQHVFAGTSLASTSSARAARAPCSILHPSSITLRVFLPATKRQSFLLHATSVCPYLRLSRSMASEQSQPTQCRPHHRRSQRLRAVSVFSVRFQCQTLVLTVCVTADHTFNRHSPPEIVTSHLPHPRTR